MSQILNSNTVKGERTDSDGKTSTVEYVQSVTFVDVNGGVHTLTFWPEGKDVAGEAEDGPRIVGTDVPSFLFTKPRDAVTAFERGEIQ